MNELFEEYPQFKGDNGIELQRYRISPVDVESQHDGEKFTMTKKAAEKFAKELEHTPLMYAECDSNLPKEHTDKYKKRKVVGSALKGYVAKGEDGVDYLMGDYVIYTDTDKEIVDKIKKFKDDVSASWEIHQMTSDSDGNIINGSYGGTSIVDKDEAAYRHHALMVADKTGGDQTTTVTLDDALKVIIGDDYNKVLTEKQTEIEALKAQIEEKKTEKEDTINTLKEENDSLRELNNGFSKLIN